MNRRSIGAGSLTCVALLAAAWGISPLAGGAAGTAQSQTNAPKDSAPAKPPRAVTEQQRTNLTACLKSLPKGDVFMCWDPQDAEAARYAAQISNVLASASYPVRHYDGCDAVFPHMRAGLDITAADPATTPAFGPLLQGCFNRNGVFMGASYPRPLQGLDTNAVLILVGQRFRDSLFPW